MSEAPWLSIIGLGEDGPDGLSRASREALDRAEIIMGPPRHLGLLGAQAGKCIEWPVPFADGVEQLLRLRGQQVAMLVSGDPFWFGAGTVIANTLAPGEWRAFPGISTFSLAATRLGWPLEKTACLGLHAAPLTRLRPYLSPGARAIALLRDAAAASELAQWLTDQGFGATKLHFLQALGGPRAQSCSRIAADPVPDGLAHPLCVGLEMAGDAVPLGLAPGRRDGFFASDGQITKAPMRALTLSALAPRHGEHLWDIGGGSGSVAVEWLLSHSSLRATTIEPRRERAARIRQNADQLGVDRLHLVTGLAPQVLPGLDAPDAVFIGGGLSEELLIWLRDHLRGGTRLVANAVTLQSQALVMEWQVKLGGELLRVDLARPAALGDKQAWRPSLPQLQWSVIL